MAMKKLSPRVLKALEEVTQDHLNEPPSYFPPPPSRALRFTEIENNLDERLTQDGTLDLTVDDLRSGSDYETATLQDVKGSRVAIHAALLISLWHPSRTKCRILKDKRNGLDPPKINSLPSRRPKWE
jgi:hypothetical protein